MYQAEFVLGSNYINQRSCRLGSKFLINIFPSNIFQEILGFHSVTIYFLGITNFEWLDICEL